MHVPGTAQRPVRTVKISTAAFPLSSLRHQWRCCCCTSEPKPDTLCAAFHLGTSQGFVCQWHKTGVLAGAHAECERGGEEDLRRKSQNISSKRLSSCAIIFCSLFFFSLSLANKLPGKAQDSPINNEKGGRGKKSSSWLEFNKSTSPSGLGLCT